ncbi:MAG: hypothetical protein U9N61_09535 [Euryarchaeota archaeon]|nr:hypothetical protein [Euryarchaeota archaeon]MEA1999542.1 hypothetical protein [Euryarchaeota archaeon]
MPEIGIAVRVLREIALIEAVAALLPCWVYRQRGLGACSRRSHLGY